MQIRFIKRIISVIGLCLVLSLFVNSSQVEDQATSFSDLTRTPYMNFDQGEGFFQRGARPAQDVPDWVNVTTSQNPGPRGYFGLVYDSESDVVIQYGGNWRTGLTYDVNETWAYSVSTNTWENVSPTEMPPGGDTRGAMTYDSENDVVILFGGHLQNDGNFSSETWAYDYNSNSWTNRTPSVSPPGRDAHSMVYDSQSKRVIMFGGRPNFQEPWQFFHDTWAYDYNTNTWTNVTSVVSPEARWFHSMVYDSKADRVILFGGYTSEFENREVGIKGDTWEFNLESGMWIEKTPTSSPSRRAYSNMAYDTINDRTILYGGSYGAGGGDSWTDILKRDTWAYNYNSNTWTDLNSYPNPGSRMRHSMVYVNESSQIVLYGGQLDDEWNPFNAETWIYTYQLNPPSAPQNLQATSGTNNITLTWQPPSTDAGSPITGYTIYRGTTSGTHNILTNLTITLNYTDTSAVPGVPYYYEITAKNAIGESQRSNEATATIPLPTPTIPIVPIVAVILCVAIALVLVIVSRRRGGPK